MVKVVEINQIVTKDVLGIRVTSLQVPLAKDILGGRIGLNLGLPEVEWPVAHVVARACRLHADYTSIEEFWAQVERLEIGLAPGAQDWQMYFGCVLPSSSSIDHMVHLRLHHRKGLTDRFDVPKAFVVWDHVGLFRIPVRQV